jgi:hypothetical protein
MANNMTNAIADATDMEKVMATSNITIGKVEQAQIKLTKAIYNAPFVKTGIAVGTVLVGLNKLFKSTNKQKKGTDKLNTLMEEEGTILTKLVVMMTMYGGAAKLAGKGTNALNKAFWSIMSSALFLFSILGLLALGAMILAVAFADVSSPLNQWLTDMPIIGELMNGLRIIMTGEDGESGLKGATDVLWLALIAGGLAFLVFGAPIGILVATIIGVVGIFKWMKNKTDSTVAAVMAAGAVLMVGLTALSVFIPGLAAAGVAGILLPFALLLAGLTGIWLSLTGKISYWWGVLSTIGAVIGAALLWAGLFPALALGIIPIAIIAAAALIIFTIVYYWDEIVAFFEAAWDYLVGLFTSIGNGIMAGIEWYVSIYTAAWTTVGNFISSVADYFGKIPGRISAWFDRTKNKVLAGLLKVRKGFEDAVASIFHYIDKKWRAIKAAPGKLLTAILQLAKIPINGLADLWNSRIKHIIPEMTIPDWMPGIGGKSWGPAPGEMKYFADGGLVNSPTLGMIGEAGPEAVIPLRGGNVPVQITGRQSEAKMVKAIQELATQVSENGNTYNINVDVSGIVATTDKAKRDLADEISLVIQKQMMQSGPAWMSSSRNPGSWI